MLRALTDDDIPIVYNPIFREYGILVSSRDSPVTQVIAYCPWCGSQLPKTLRSEYFDEIWGLGLEIESPSLPLRFRSDAWWRSEDLE
jgi:hypothetical protein